MIRIDDSGPWKICHDRSRSAAGVERPVSIWLSGLDVLSRLGMKGNPRGYGSTCNLGNEVRKRDGQQRIMNCLQNACATSERPHLTNAGDRLYIRSSGGGGRPSQAKDRGTGHRLRANPDQGKDRREQDASSTRTCNNGQPASRRRPYKDHAAYT